VKDIECVDHNELEQFMEQGAKVVDIRTDMEWKNTGIIDKSHRLTFFDRFGNYDMHSWLANFEKIVSDKSESFVLVCAHANRTKILGSFLRDKLGYKNVFELCGGIELGWIARGKMTKDV